MTTPNLLRRGADRTLWAGVAWVIAGALLALGFAYLVGGLHVTASDRVYVYVRRPFGVVPGGMHTHGGIMLALGLAMLWGLIAPTYGLPIRHHHLRRVLLAVCGYAGWLVFAFAAAWASVAPPVWWLVMFALSALLILLPPERRERRPSQHRRRRGRRVP